MDKEKLIDNSWKAKMVENGIYKDSETTPEETVKDLKDLAGIIRDILVNRTDISYIPDLAFPIAKEVLKHYQPKLTEDSVVLSRKEYEILQRLYDEIFMCQQLPPHRAVENAKIFFASQKELINKACKFASKETSEKWYNEVKTVYLENVGEQVFEHNWFGIQLNKFAKQFDVEVNK